MEIASSIAFLVAFGAGLISFLSPCVFPLVPSYVSVGGVVLVVMGVLLFTGYLTVLNTYAISLTPQWLWSWL